MPLSETAVRNAKPTEKPFKLFDGGGLFLLVNPTGSRLWRMKYRYEGREKLLALGAYPDVGLKAARERRDIAKGNLLSGSDPSRVTLTIGQTAPAQEDTFEKVATDWLSNKDTGWVPAYARRVEARMRADVFPEIGRMPIAEVNSRHVLDMLRKVEKRGAIEMAKRIRQYVSGVFVFAIAEGRATSDPAASVGAALKPKPRTKHRTKLQVGALPQFIRDVRAYDGEPVTRLAIELVLHTWVRTSEIRFGRWDEIDGDLWRIPAERMKMSRDHLVPLTPQSQRILAELKAAGGKSEWIAPGDNGPMSENTMLYAIYRMGYHKRATIHGLRGTASTICNESGLFDEDWIEKQLAHEESDDVRAAYNAAEYLDHRVKMMRWWSDFIDSQAVVTGN